MIHSYREKRLALKSRKAPNNGISERTVNLDVIALRHVLRFAIDGGLIDELPKVRALKPRLSDRRPLLTKEQFNRLLAAATEETTKNSRLFRYYSRFLALTGAREKESLAVRQKDVDFARGSVTIGADGASKNSKARDIDCCDGVTLQRNRRPSAIGKSDSLSLGKSHQIAPDLHCPNDSRTRLKRPNSNGVVKPELNCALNVPIYRIKTTTSLPSGPTASCSIARYFVSKFAIIILKELMSPGPTSTRSEAPVVSPDKPKSRLIACRRDAKQSAYHFFEIAGLLMCFNHIACVIENANHKHHSAQSRRKGTPGVGSRLIWTGWPPARGCS
jgi:hypothetical protein